MQIHNSTNEINFSQKYQYKIKNHFFAKLKDKIPNTQKNQMHAFLIQ